LAASCPLRGAGPAKPVGPATLASGKELYQTLVSEIIRRRDPSRSYDDPSRSSDDEATANAVPARDCIPAPLADDATEPAWAPPARPPHQPCDSESILSKLRRGSPLYQEAQTRAVHAFRTNTAPRDDSEEEPPRKESTKTPRVILTEW